MIKAILVDIEGTTSSIDFVHKKLFPYARARMRDYLRAHGQDRAVRRELDEVSKLEGRPLTPEEAAAVLERWIDEDRKVTPLKALQGMIWRRGYEAGELTGHMYPDTPTYLKQWHDAGKKLYIYSSGSVDAQKLIFGHTDYGDLTPLFSGYFDTRVGGKRESAAYVAILRAIGLDGPRVLFLSDVGEELDAAKQAGLRTCQLLREPSARSSASHPHASTFADVKL